MNADTPYDVLFEEYVVEMDQRTKSGEYVKIELSLSAALSTLATLQLALRILPPMSGQALAAVAVAQMIEQAVATSPAIAEAIRRGWLEQYDEVHHARAH